MTKLNLVILLHGYFGAKNSDSEIIKSIYRWRAVFPDCLIIASTWGLKKITYKRNLNLIIIRDKDPGRLKFIRKMDLGNLNRHIQSQKNSLTVMNNSIEWVLSVREDIIPSDKSFYQIYSYIKKGFIEISKNVFLEQKDLLVLSEGTASLRSIFPTNVLKPFHVCDFLYLMKYSKFKYFFRSIPLFQSSLNDISEDSLIKCRRVSVARGDLTPENYAGIFLASIFFKSSFKFRMEEYRKFLNLIAICPMNILGFKWQKSSRLTACIHGYLNRINPELFYKRNLNFKGLSLVLGLIKFYLKAIISLRISCFFDILTSLKKRC